MPAACTACPPRASLLHMISSFGPRQRAKCLSETIRWLTIGRNATRRLRLRRALRAGDRRRYLEHARSVGQRPRGDHPQRVARRGRRSRGHRDRRHARAPFPDATFDLVVSSLAIHTIRSNADRRQAVAEGFRVLKPGGRMGIADIRATSIYADALRTLGASNVERRRLGWRFWWGNPFAATTLLTASKPPA